MTDGSQDDAAAAARRWLHGHHRTWRWNDGSYQNKNRYDAVETTASGLLWFGFDGTREGIVYRELQGFADFRARGPRRELPDTVLAELREWLAQHGH